MNPKANNLIDPAIFGSGGSGFWLGELAHGFWLRKLAWVFWHEAFGLGLLTWGLLIGSFGFWLRASFSGVLVCFLIHRAKFPNLQAKHCNALLDL